MEKKLFEFSEIVIEILASRLDDYGKKTKDEILNFCKMVYEVQRDHGWIETFFIRKALRSFISDTSEQLNAGNVLKRALNFRASMLYAMPNKEKEKFKAELQSEEKQYLLPGDEQKQIQG